MAKKKEPADGTRPNHPPAGPNNGLVVPRQEGETADAATARRLLAPDFRHGIVAAQMLKVPLGGADFSPGIGDYADAIQAQADGATNGELAFASRMLAAQAVTLDTIFAEMARRMALNMGEYLGATETYARIAMKAQAQSRATLEALAKLHQPREQTVRHVHVNEGGQAVIAGQFHNHTGGQENGKSADQPYTQGSCGPALLGTDPCGNGMPIPSREGEPALSNARREG